MLIATVLSLTLNELESAETARTAERTARLLLNILDTAEKTSNQQQESLKELVGVTSQLSSVAKRQEDAVEQGAQISTKVSATLDAQRRVTNQVLRAYYPLEPVTLFFERELAMDQPALQRYMARLEAAITATFRDSKRKLAGETFIDLMEHPEWLPVRDGAEHEAWLALMTDATSFSFDAGARDSDIILSSLPRATGTVMNALSPGERIAQKIELSANFGRRVLTIHVRCDFAVRSGGDVTAVSAVDLIDRQLAALRDRDADAVSRVTRVALKFRYDYDARPTRSRYIALPSDGSTARVTPTHVGLHQVLLRQ